MTAPDERTLPLREVIDLVTEEQVRKALDAARGSVNVAADALGVDRTTVYRLMRRYGIEIRRIVA